MAGPRALEHLVDVVLHFEGDRHAQLRMVRALKNRFGPTDEVGCFELGETGLAGLADPSGLFISHHAGHVPGTCLTVTLEGRRPLIAEVQTLLAPCHGLWISSCLEKNHSETVWPTFARSPGRDAEL